MTVGAVAVVAALAVGLVLIRGIRMSAWTTLGVECVSIVIVAAVLLVLLTRQHTGEPVRSAFTFDGDLQLLAVGVVVAVSAFVGFESSTTLSGEAQQPFRSIPRAVAWTPALSAAIYLTAVPILAIALRQAPASGSSTPLVELLLADGSRTLAAFLDLGIAASFFACTLASMNALVRVLFCMGREGSRRARSVTCIRGSARPRTPRWPRSRWSRWCRWWCWPWVRRRRTACAPSSP